jgi:hypothetical protein
MSTRLYPRIAVAGAVALVALAAACGGSSSSSTTGPTTSGTMPSSSAPSSSSGSTRSSGGGAGALVGEANAAAAGDIPDNQVFITYANASQGYSVKYPEGWAQQGNGATVVFRDKNNEMRIVAGQGAVTTSAVKADVQQLMAQTTNFKVLSQPVANPTCTNAGKTVKLPRVSAKVVYQTESKPNAVTGKKVTLIVDRYYLAHGGKRVIVDLASPKGVDNVDAYCLMISSFTWK